MEHLLFYLYLNFQREQFAALGNKLRRIPIHITILFVAVFLSLIFGLASMFFSFNRWIGITAVIAEVVFALAFYVSVEKFCIKNSQKHMRNYWDYCAQLKKVLLDANVHTRADIKEIKERLEKQIQTMNYERSAANTSYMKLAEIVAVPVILAIITTSIAQKDDISEMVAIVILILSAAGILFATVLSILSLARFPKKRKIEQMSEFCEDLQGILDLDRFGSTIDSTNAVE